MCKLMAMLCLLASLCMLSTIAALLLLCKLIGSAELFAVVHIDCLCFCGAIVHVATVILPLLVCHACW